MKLVAIVFGCIAAFASMQAAATDDFNRTINTVGLQGSTAFVSFKEGVSGGCVFGTIYLGSVDTAATKAMYAALLSARATGGKISHVGYSVGSDGVCSANVLELQ